ncbi:glutathione-dependent formaldehyde dehydrogenase [Mycobacterium antarcticum]|nr:glutathione-dependent formaldehyde dehydrogenase [Mycolicibacterium sp. TUM20983]
MDTPLGVSDDETGVVMKAVTWHGKRDVRVEQVPDPKIQEPTDAIIEVTSTNICGSDLHLYEVLGAFMTPGDVLGHEPMGIVREVGKGVSNLSVGDRVVIPFQISCGSCFMCDAQLYTQCETTQVRDQGMGAALFGFSELYGAVPGGQAELLRVPQAQFTHIKVPDGPPDSRFVYLSDVLPTAWQAVQYAGIPDGGSVTVLGLGPIGDMAARIAHHLGYDVIGVDMVPERLARTAARGIRTVDLREIDFPVGDAIRSMTDGRGTDSVIDAVGMEAHGSPVAKAVQDVTALLPDAIAKPMMEKAGVDRLDALYSAIDVVRRGGTVSIIGVYGGTADPLPLLTMFDKQIQVRMGQANVKRWVDDIMPLLTDDDPLGVDTFASHVIPLDDAPHAYDIFQKKQDDAVKIILKP